MIYNKIYIILKLTINNIKVNSQFITCFFSSLIFFLSDMKHLEN